MNQVKHWVAQTCLQGQDFAENAYSKKQKPKPKPTEQFLEENFKSYA